MHAVQGNQPAPPALWDAGTLAIPHHFHAAAQVHAATPGTPSADWGSGLPREALLQVFMLLPEVDR